MTTISTNTWHLTPDTRHDITTSSSLNGRAHHFFCSSRCRACSHRTARRSRGRSCRARHLAWGETRGETDATAVVHAPDNQEWTRVSEVESDVDHLESPGAVPEADPVTGESFCQCDRRGELSSGCLCGEEDEGFEWEWDEHSKSSGVLLSCDNRKVSFHSDYSCGTAAVRGTKELTDGQHFWEVKMTSPVYGTDMMVGIGTAEVNMEKFNFSFGSLLGHDEDSWGLSYAGLLQHKGDKVKFSSRFGQGSIIGVHLDTWHGTLTLYKNRRRIGVAATRLQNRKFYPMVCSTAAKSSMKVIRACWTPTSLQYLCCARLRQTSPCRPSALDAAQLPPGLRAVLHLRLGWLLSLSGGQDEEPLEDFHRETSRPCSPRRGSTPGACTSRLDALQYDCPCRMSPQTTACTWRYAQSPRSGNYDGCSSEPEDYQSKRCRWA
ncbi:SPRY domain-containing SOCS box protein 3 isoform 2-T2 [Spinachia spinachia]